ncbi:MAG TPA: TonB-dependent receptor [Flavobacteriaceae bacterium]|nr:TonB-dependent receptor [Flavobacteriaceae bacterium]
MKQCLRALLFFCSLTTFAQFQPFTISGTLTTEDTQKPLESATIYVERAKDSTLVTYTISDQDGAFRIEEKTTDPNLKIYISYVGFETYEKEFEATSEEINLGTIVMKTNANTLDEVVLKSRAPITIKKDTLEFNVKSFKTKKDATVEDLLKKLPGVEVDAEGQITVNGKEVNKILVNGKPFFGDDPTITTRNLTKEIIEKVQVTDTKTDAEAFAGEASDGQNKTINLTIKEENNKGVFGRVAGGAGTDERYEFAGFFNRFDNDQRISVLAGGNNINSAGFSFGEIRKMFGGGRSIFTSSDGSFGIDGRRFGGGEGIVRSRNAGANYADTYGEKFEITADHFYAGSNSENRNSTQRENILPDSRFFTNSNSESFTENNTNNTNVRLDIKVDSTFLINVRPSITYGTGNRRFSNDEISRNEVGETTNQAETFTFSENINRSFRNDLDITKRFGDRGASLNVSLNTEFENNDAEQFLESSTEVFGDNPSVLDRNQFTDEKFTLDSYFASISYRYPIIAKKLFLNPRYSHREDTRTSVESTFDFNEDAQDFIDFNQALSTNFEYTNRRSTPSLGLQYNGEKLSANLSASYVFRTLENVDALRPQTSFEQDFEAVEVNAYGNYRFSPKASLYANYRLNNSPPDVQQLQPFQDVSDPLNVVTGNPNLEPTNQHNVYMGYNAFDFQKGTGFGFWANGNLTENQIVPQTTIDENFVRTTTYTNVDGNYYFYGSGNYSKNVKLDTIREVKFRVAMSVNTNQSINFNNGVEYASNNVTYSPDTRITFTWKKWFEFIPSYRLSFTNTTYDLDAFDDRSFVRHNVGLETATFFPEKLEWRNDIDYSYNPDVAAGFQRSVLFWNSTLAYSVLKDKGTITLKVYDILGQNNNTRRTATANYIQDSQSTVLERYVMLSFSWKFNSLGKKGEVNDGGFFRF